RARALQVVLVLVGLVFTAAVYPVAMDLWRGDASDTGDTMMMSLYFTLGIFLLLAVCNPSAHRSVIAFAAWSRFAHAVLMSALGLLFLLSGLRRPVCYVCSSTHCCAVTAARHRFVRRGRSPLGDRGMRPSFAYSCVFAFCLP